MTTQELAAKEKQELQGHEQVRPGRYYVPEVDIYEDADGLRLWADMPGVDPTRLNVEVHEDTLTVQGEVDLGDYDGLSPEYTEYNVGHFLRRFTLPQSEHIDRSRISAKLVDGVLQVELPKAEHTKPKRITVNVG